MKITYPHMGYLSIPVKKMLTNLGVTVVESPPITKKTIELGAMYSPEGVCLPYKMNMGNILESIEQGADTVISVCGEGKCRLGFYNAVQKIALAKMKKEIQFFTVDTNHVFSTVYQCLRQTAWEAGYTSILKNIVFAIESLKALDAVSNVKNIYGARSQHPQQVINIYNTFLRQFAECQSFHDVNSIKNVTMNLIKAVKERECNPPKVALIGEFYMLLEPYVNRMIEDILIKQGIEVRKFVFTGEWVYANTLLKALKLYNEEKSYMKQAKPYLNHHVGGDGLKSVGCALWCAKNGYDGIIHIYPFGCMPEVVAQYALKNLVSDYNLPMLSLSIDEHASDVGIMTRIEAFADCIKLRKKNKG